MSIRVDCPECNVKLQVPDQVAGRRVRCPACKNVFRVPAAPVAMPVAPPPAAEPVPVGAVHAEEVDLAEIDFFSDPQAEHESQPATDFEPEPEPEFEPEPEPEFEPELEPEPMGDFEPDEEEEPRPAKKDRNGKKKQAKPARGESKPGFFARLFGGGKPKKVKKSKEPKEEDFSSD